MRKTKSLLFLFILLLIPFTLFGCKTKKGSNASGSKIAETKIEYRESTDISQTEAEKDITSELKVNADNFTIIATNWGLYHSKNSQFPGTIRLYKNGGTLKIISKKGNISKVFLRFGYVGSKNTGNKPCKIEVAGQQLVAENKNILEVKNLNTNEIIIKNLEVSKGQIIQINTIELS